MWSTTIKAFMHSVIPSQIDSAVNTNTILQSLKASLEINNTLICSENPTKIHSTITLWITNSCAYKRRRNTTSQIMKMNAGSRHRFDQLCKSHIQIYLDIQK